MTKRFAFSVLAAAVLTLVGTTAVSAGPLGLGQTAPGVGSAVNAVQPPSLVNAAGDAVGNEIGTVPDTANHVIPADTGSSRTSPAFAGSAEAPAVPTDSYRAFENLVNDVQDGGGWHGEVVTNDAFSPDGIDGGVPGVASIPPLARIAF